MAESLSAGGTADRRCWPTFCREVPASTWLDVPAGGAAAVNSRHWCWRTNTLSRSQWSMLGNLLLSFRLRVCSEVKWSRVYSSIHTSHLNESWNQPRSWEALPASFTLNAAACHKHTLVILTSQQPCWDAAKREEAELRFPTEATRFRLWLSWGSSNNAKKKKLNRVQNDLKLKKNGKDS